MGPRELLIEFARWLEWANADYFVTDSMASMAYGEYRSTLDVDVVVDLKYVHVRDLLDRFHQPEYYLSDIAIREAMENCSQFIIIQVPTGLKIDVMIPDNTPYNTSRFARAREIKITPDESVRVSAPEDVILKKLEYYKEGGSDKHPRDIASMIKVSGETFDREYLERWAAALGVVEEWNRIKARVGW